MCNSYQKFVQDQGVITYMQQLSSLYKIKVIIDGFKDCFQYSTTSPQTM